ncbi:RHS repeat domain-containing protein [Streptomyces sp. NPDC002276]
MPIPSTGHRVTAVVVPYGRHTELSYDANGHVTNAVELAVTSSARSSSSVVFDGAYDQPGSVTDALGHKTTFTYDADGNLTKTTDPQGRATSYTYNSAGQVTTATDAAQAVTAYTYANGNLTAVTETGSGDDHVMGQGVRNIRSLRRSKLALP